MPKFLRRVGHDFALGQDMLTSNTESDLVPTAMFVYSMIQSNNWLNLKAMDIGNTTIHGFLHSFIYLFAYSRLTIKIFNDKKSGTQMALMTSSSVQRRGRHEGSICNQSTNSLHTPQRLCMYTSRTVGITCTMLWSILFSKIMFTWHHIIIIIICINA